MKKVYLFSLCFIFISVEIYGFQTLENDTITAKDILKPNILSTHPFGLFFNRIQGNFKTKPSINSQLSLNLDSGNVWGTPITVYIPNDPNIRNEIKALEWDQAQYFYDEESLDAEVYSLQIDGVIKSFRVNGTFAINERSELVIATRLFMLTEGKSPFSIFTSDKFIENFHSKIAGGNDPFDRQVFGLNNAQITYTDRNGRTLDLGKNDVIFGGFETSYYYYPTNWGNEALKLNIGSHLGINLSKYNSSLDVGASINGIYTYNIGHASNINFGVGIGAMNKGIIKLQNDNLDFGSNSFIGHLETVIEFNFNSKKDVIHAIGLDYYLQTRLFKRSELDYSILIRHPDAHNSWGHGVTNLYKTNNYWSLYYAFGKKVIKSLYLQQDFQVNNNPDIQTGIGVSFQL